MDKPDIKKQGHEISKINAGKSYYTICIDNISEELYPLIRKDMEEYLRNLSEKIKKYQSENNGKSDT